MAIKGQTHAKRAREFELKERRERKKAKKEARNSVAPPEEGDTSADVSLQTEPEPVAEWVQ